jgi:hypothetical protein
LRKPLEAAAPPQAFKQTLGGEADSLAQEVRSAAPGELGRTVEVRDLSDGMKLTYRVGTPDPAGRFLEFGTVRLPASPWLWPIFRARLPGIKQRLRKIAVAALKMPPTQV